MIRVAFRYSDRRPFARLVGWWDRTDTAHCEVAWAWSEPQHECVSSSWLDGGVRGKSLALLPSRWRIYEVDAQPQLALAWLARHKDKRYDWLGLLGFVWRPLRDFRRRWFCSEACADILGIADPWRFSPAALEAVIARMGRRIQ